MTDKQRVGDKDLTDDANQPQAQPDAGRNKNAATGHELRCSRGTIREEKRKPLTPNARNQRRAQRVRWIELLAADANLHQSLGKYETKGHCKNTESHRYTVLPVTYSGDAYYYWQAYQYYCLN
jgi:hypothetical protein